MQTMCFWFDQCECDDSEDCPCAHFTSMDDFDDIAQYALTLAENACLYQELVEEFAG